MMMTRGSVTGSSRLRRNLAALTKSVQLHQATGAQNAHQIQIDQMGNIFAIRLGENNQLPPIAIGSHLDTQPVGGKYDGILGRLTTFEALPCLVG